ncbi:MAG: glycosyl hydrolase 2 galactose-binding domain-containing protein [Janthinobacterium lividum]
MSATRREFLKTTAIAGASLALPGIAFAETSEASAGAAPFASETPEATGSAAFTRGIGMYPGAPDQNFQPELIPDGSGASRNLALLRPAFHSSSYDYNLTAQLVTDGIIDTRLPSWITSVVNGEILPKPERDILVDHFQSAVIELPGTHPFVELHLGGGDELPEVDRLGLFVVVPQTVSPDRLTFTASVSHDGYTYMPAGSTVGSSPLPPENYPPDLAHGAHLLTPSIPLTTPGRYRYYRVQFGVSGGEAAAAGTANAGTTEAAMATAMPSLSWRLGQLEFYRGQQRIQIGGPYHFTSAWKPAGMDEEWVYVDLGGRFTFDRVALHWIARPAEGKLQVSDDAHHWTDLQPLPAASNDSVDDMHLTTPGQGRYVRALLTRPATEHGYLLSEFEVFGRGGFIVRPKAAATPTADGRLNLDGGGWKLYRVAENPFTAPQAEPGTPSAQQPVATGEACSTPGFHDTFWLPATVPATTLTSYFNVGAIPDPNFGQNQLHISDSFFYADFWYRTEFTPAPTSRPDQLQWLNLDGINWKADVYLNGAKLGRIDGGFMRGRFNVTGKLLPGKPNALAILVLKNDTPGSCKQKTLETTGKNGGALGADNPTFHSSIGWDWIPTIRGRNTGIWNDVYLTQTGAVTLEDPLVTSKLPLPDTRHADISLEVFAVNHSAKPVSGTLRGRFGTVAFEQRVSLAASETQTVKLSPATHKQFRITNPELWWPVGYGEPHLYDVELSFEGREGKGGQLHDRKQFKAGIRQMTADENGGALHMFINGRRFVPRGGNWGFSESMLRYRAREYDAAVRYHREMNFTMIRDWVGQIGEDAFYDACDKYGVVVWQDFWLANPWDGPVPNDNAMFLANSRDYIRKIRQHACIGLYCGRNEWYPPAALQTGIKALLTELHPDIYYIGSSADGPVSGHGPYRALPTPDYFRLTDKKFHSEIGAPCIPPLESIRAMMPESALWPLSLDYGLHDFTLSGAQGGTSMLSLIADSYGGVTNVEDWTAISQFINYETYRAMFEAQSKYRMGVLLWMSHPCWPSFVWQTYDFYLEPTSAYFACKKASEPLHIQWNSYTDTIEVVNMSAGNRPNLTAEVDIVNMDGKSAGKKNATLASAEDSVSTPITMDYPAGLTPVHFLRLTLSENGTPVSTNFYMRGVEQNDFRAIRTLGEAQVTAHTTSEQRGNRWFLTTTLQNTSPFPALMVRAKATRATTGDRILPALYDDNYIALMPNETRTLKTELNHADTRNETPKITIEGFNVARA